VALPLTVAASAGQRSTGTAPVGGVESTVRFDSVASTSGLDFHHVNGASSERYLPEIMSGGGLFFDYNNDGWVDVFLVDGGSLADRGVAARARHRLYRNRGNGTFVDVSATSGIVNTQYGMGACAADYDNDGWIDLYVTNVGSNALYHNNGGKTFNDVTKSAGVYVDARPDNNIFCGESGSRARLYCHPLNFAPLASVLYHNNGNGTFTDVSAQAGIAAHHGNGLGVVVGDYDDDGWPDIFVANDTTPNFLYHNEGKGVFKEVGLLTGVAVASDGTPRAGMGTDFGDYDGDGRLDLFVTNHEMEMHSLFHNLGGGLFEDVTSRSGVGLETLPFVGFGTVFLDYDNDGDLDLAIANGHVLDNSGHFRPGLKEAQRKLLFRNDDGRFKEVGRLSGPGFAVEKIGRALAVADIDNDGNLDLLFVNNGDEVDLLRNGGVRDNNALTVRIVGTHSNRSGIGARVRLTAAGRTQVREVKAGSSYLGQSDLRVHFGIGGATRIERLEIRWPAGESEVASNLAVNQIITVVEGKGVTERKPLVRR
jgi:enediyne biosynthesis protein E4